MRDVQTLSGATTDVTVISWPPNYGDPMRGSWCGIHLDLGEDEDELGEQDDYGGGVYDDQHDESYGDGEMGQYHNDHGHEGAAGDGMW